MPYQERLARYTETRNRIFGGVNSFEHDDRIRRSTRRARSFWKGVRDNRRRLISASFLNKDSRLYTDIEIDNHSYIALLDSGATVSCIGGDAAKTFNDHPQRRNCSGYISTAIYSPQANASERLNRSVLAAIRAYVGQDHTNWDKQLSEISGSLRANFHRSIGFSPYYLCFGQNMILNGKDYDLLRKTDLLQDDVAMKYPDFLQLARQEAKARIADSHETNARKYNLRSRTVQLKVGDTVFARNFAQSNAVKKFSSN